MPPAALQIKGEHFYFFVTRATEKRYVDTENLALSLTRLSDFLVEREVKKTFASSIRPEPRTTASTGAVCFDTNIQVYLHRKYYFSIG